MQRRSPWGLPPFGLLLVLCLGTAAAGQQPHRLQPVPTEERFVLTGSPGIPLRQPTDAAFGASSRLYVLDGLNSRVAVFGTRGEYLSSFGTHGSLPGQLDRPVGIGTAPDGEVFVADTGNHRIQVFSPDGKFLRAFGLKSGDRADPTDVQPSPLKDFCYVCDNDNHEIQVYNGKTGRFLARWGGRGKAVGEFRYPSTLALDGKDNLYVVDVLNARLQTFNPYGKRGREIATWGVRPEGLFRPKGVATDASDRVYVSDSYMGWVKVFDAGGELLGVVAGPDGRVRQLATPTSLATDDQGRLCVVETRASRVSVLRFLP